MKRHRHRHPSVLDLGGNFSDEMDSTSDSDSESASESELMNDEDDDAPPLFPDYSQDWLGYVASSVIPCDTNDEEPVMDNTTGAAAQDDDSLAKIPARGDADEPTPTARHMI